MAYKAFISYSHAADGKLAPALQSALHRFAKPFYRLRAVRVFRDKTSLQVTPQLWPVIQQSLAESEYFLLMASPEAAGSRWVQAEVAEWLRLRNGSADKLLLIVTGGEAAWDDNANDFDWGKTTALPPNLRGTYEREPLYCDLRWARTSTDLSLRNPQFLDAVGALGATLHGKSKDEMIGDDVRQHRLFKSLLAAVAVLLFGLTVAASGTAFYAVRQRDEAQRQTAVARRQKAEADQQRQSALESAERERRAAENERLARENEQRQRKVAEQATRNERDAKEQAEKRRAEADDQRRLADERRVEAERERNIATSRELASAAVAQLPSDPELSLLLSLDAHKRTPAPTAEAEESLRLSLLRSHVRGTYTDIVNLAFSPDWKWSIVVKADEATATELETGRTFTLEFPTPYKFIPQVRFSSDGRLALMLCRDPDLTRSTVYIWEVGSWRRFTELHPKNYQFDARFSQDGRLVLMEGRNESQAWNLESNKALEFEEEKLLASLDGRVLISTGKGYVRARESTKGEMLWEMSCGTANSFVDRPAFSPDSKYLSLRCYEKPFSTVQTYVVEAATGREVMTFPHSAYSSSIGFSPDSRWLVTTCGDSTACVWEVSTWQKVAELRGHTAGVVTFLFSPDNKWLITSSPDPVMLVWEVGTWRNVDKLRGQAGVFSTFDVETKVLTTLCGEGAMCVWQVGSWQLLTTLQGSFRPITGLRVSPGGRYIVTNHYDRTTRFWEVNADDGVTEIVGAGGGVFGHAPRMMYSPDSKNVAVRNPYGFVNVVEVATGRKVVLDRGEFLAFSPDGKYVFMKGGEYTIQIWDASTGEKVQDLHGHTYTAANIENHLNDVEDIAFSPDGKWVVTAGGYDSTARVWEMGTWRSVAVLNDPFSVTHVAFSPDNKWLITTGVEAHVWKVGTWQAVTDLAGHKGEVASVAFSPDGQRVVTSSRIDKTARVWEVNSWRCILVLSGHTLGLAGATFSPDGQRILTWSDDNTTRLWDAGTGAAVAMLAGDPIPWRSDHPNRVHSAAFSPDGSLIAVASGQTVQVWDAREARIVKILPTLMPGKDTDNSPRTVNGATFSPDGKSLMVTANNGVMRSYKWEIFAPFEEILKLARTRVTRDLTSYEKEKYLHETADNNQ